MLTCRTRKRRAGPCLNAKGCVERKVYSRTTGWRLSVLHFGIGSSAPWEKTSQDSKINSEINTKMRNTWWRSWTELEDKEWGILQWHSIKARMTYSKWIVKSPRWTTTRPNWSNWVCCSVSNLRVSSPLTLSCTVLIEWKGAKQTVEFGKTRMLTTKAND